jgi:hypothetical protein
MNLDKVVDFGRLSSSVRLTAGFLGWVLVLYFSGLLNGWWILYGFYVILIYRLIIIIIITTTTPSTDLILKTDSFIHE